MFTPGEYRKFPQVSVEIYQPVRERIFRNVSTSPIEEGGKLIGALQYAQGRLRITVQSYLDAGPRVSSSASHIFPDGEHQENLFRLVEGYDPRIEHIGSWHSHHCNGLSHLSQGDIEGYLQSVNARAYNLDWFFAMLVTRLRPTGFDANFYLFQRGNPAFYQVPEPDVVIVRREYPWEHLLTQAEQASRIARGLENPDPQGGLRADDHGWLKKNYPGVQLVRNKQNDTLTWRWTIPAQLAELEVTYSHPSPAPGRSQPARLGVRCRDNQLLECDIPLDDTRHQKIAALLAETRSRLP